MKQFLLMLVMAAMGTTAALAQSVKTQSLVPAPQGVFLDSYHEHDVLTSDTDTNVWVDALDWTNGAGGYGSGTDNGETEVEDFWPEVAWPQWASAEGESAGVVEWDEDGIGNIWNISTNTGELYPLTLGEHCDVNWYYPAPEFDWQQRTADTEYKLATGGPPGSKQQNLWVISATAWAHTNVVDGYGTPVPPQQIQIGSFGNLDTNGNLYVLLPDNDPDNVTPKVNGDDKYTFTVGAQKYTLIHQVDCMAPGDTNLDRTTIGIGEVVHLSGMPANTIWQIPGGGYISGTNGSSIDYFAPMSPTNDTVNAAVETAHISITFKVIPPSSFIVFSNYDEPIGTPNPQGTKMGAQTHFLCYVGPTNVSFSGVKIREVLPPSPVVWPNGTNDNTAVVGETNGISFPCGANLDDLNGSGEQPISYLFNGTNYVDFSYGYTWKDQYQNESGDWIDFLNLNCESKYRGSDKACQVVYQGVSGGWQEPHN